MCNNIIDLQVQYYKVLKNFLQVKFHILLIFVNNNSGEIMFYINFFLFFSIFGYLFETLCAYIFKSGFNSGILYGPWTPLYGFGVIIIMLLSNKIFESLHLNKVVETIVVFVVITIVLTVLEWLGGVLIEKLFHITFWDYSNYKYHIGKYISLEMSLLWGVGGIILIYLVIPYVCEFIKKIPFFITVFLSSLFIIDVIVTTINKLKK